jgi:hypothetical protein
MFSAAATCWRPKLRRSNIDASAGAVGQIERIVGRIRARSPRVRVLLRADNGFAREAIMVWPVRAHLETQCGNARAPARRHRLPAAAPPLILGDKRLFGTAPRASCRMQSLECLILRS